ncbi:hypothetical protein [Lapillicoccus jejuensis]|uniref:Uncharacterized protein n=1 Tax=Lapillicoccus jejuensis TaxID=402171 RepID=A0A542E026_9MICO|nr:hypothetical protein [Lapillicoccus jejuensis]TQJ08639.1 hypothetical protein FB458_1730 [Lapillicoccus jejuensis]
MSTIAKVRHDEPYVAGESIEKTLASVRDLITHLVGLKGAVPTPLLRKQLSTALWQLTELSGVPPHAKYNVRFVSRGVKEQPGDTKVNHEHVTPRKSVSDRLLTARPGDSGITECLSDAGIACIVTVQEHGMLGNEPGLGWGRYEQAGVQVFDRLTQQWRTSASPTTPDRTDVDGLIDAKASAPELLHRLLHVMRAAGSEAVAGVSRKDGSPTHYFRLHDVTLPEPTRAFGYVHWSGVVDVALPFGDVPAQHRGRVTLVERTNRTRFRTRLRLSEAGDLQLATDLLTLSLDNLREDHREV